MSKKLENVLNINTGVVVPRTAATDENPVIFRRIDDETAKAINERKVAASVVIDAIEKREFGKPGFSWREYDRLRRDADKLLNVSKRDMTPVGAAPNSEESAAEGNSEVLSMKDLGIGNAEETKAKAKANPREKADRPSATVPPVSTKVDGLAI